jgi:ring-1,2-phenylacetyl-CoA epoxidase subunit PaaD
MVNGAVTEAAVWRALAGVTDPEIPVLSVVDLGVVTGVEVSAAAVRVELTPTFVGCPAIGMMRQAAERAVREVAGDRAVEVVVRAEAAWSTDRISGAGRARLSRLGVAPPAPAIQADPLRGVTCPFCNSAAVRLENLFGPTACRSLWYCTACRNPFEAMKPL